MELEEFLDGLKKEDENKDISYPIKKLKIYEDYVMLYLEEEKIQLSVDSYFEHKIKDLKGLDEDLYKKLKNEEILFKAYRSALRKLAYKDHTVAQIKDHLKGKGLNRKQIDEMTGKLISYGLLDDEKYCMSRISYLKDSKLSGKQIRYKLKKEGISEQLITKHLKVDQNEEYTKALQLAEKFERTIRNKSCSAKKKAILNKLVGLGYSYETASSAVQSADMKDENELELLRKEFDKALHKYERKYEGRDLDDRIIASLLQKGFSYSDIRTVMEEKHGKES